MIGPENNRWVLFLISEVNVTVRSGVNMRALEELFQRAAARAEDWIDTISVRDIVYTTHNSI